MPPMYGEPNYNFDGATDKVPNDESNKAENGNSGDLTQMAFWYMMVLIILIVSWILIFFCLRIIAHRQKTRSTQQRRVYVGSRTRQLSVQEPTIYVSPANLPPPPKYEAMAPPSYEEVMGSHYLAQPITQPITHALHQSTSNTNNAANNSSVTNEANNAVNSVTNNTAVNETTPPTTLTITNENRRSSVPVSS